MAYKDTSPECSGALFKSGSGFKYFYGSFKGDRKVFTRFYYENGYKFPWDEHINQTFRRCMKPMTDKFMKVM